MFNKSFYIPIIAVFLTLFIISGLILYVNDGIVLMPDIHIFSPTAQIGNMGVISAFLVQLISGVFSSSQVTFVFNMMCLLFSSYFVFLTLKTSITKELALVMTAVYLLIIQTEATSGFGGPLCCLLSSFIIYLYYLKYDGDIKWYVILLCLGWLSIHLKIFLIALYTYPLVAYNEIKEQKTAWHGFINMIVLLLGALVIHFGFVNNFPIMLFEGNIRWNTLVPDIINQPYTNYFILLCIMIFMFAFSLVGIMFCKRFIKGYVKYSIAYFALIMLSFVIFGADAKKYITFLPPIFISFSNVLCHLPVFRKYRKIFTLIILIIATVLFLFI